MQRMVTIRLRRYRSVSLRSTILARYRAGLRFARRISSTMQPPIFLATSHLRSSGAQVEKSRRGIDSPHHGKGCSRLAGVTIRGCCSIDGALRSCSWAAQIVTIGADIRATWRSIRMLISKSPDQAVQRRPAQHSGKNGRDVPGHQKSHCIYVRRAIPAAPITRLLRRLRLSRRNIVLAAERHHGDLARPVRAASQCRISVAGRTTG